MNMPHLHVSRVCWPLKTINHILLLLCLPQEVVGCIAIPVLCGFFYFYFDKFTINDKVYRNTLNNLSLFAQHYIDLISQAAEFMVY